VVLAMTNESTEIQPRYTRISKINITFDISSAGKSSCYCKVTTIDWADDIDLTMELQRLEDGGWTTIKTWTNSGTGSVPLDKIWYVLSGYDFRLKITAKVYDAKGVWKETVTDYSYTVTY